MVFFADLNIRHFSLLTAECFSSKSNESNEKGMIICLEYWWKHLICFCLGIREDRASRWKWRFWSGYFYNLYHFRVLNEREGKNLPLIKVCWNNALPLSHWATETLRWARYITKFIWLVHMTLIFTVSYVLVLKQASQVNWIRWYWEMSNQASLVQADSPRFLESTWISGKPTEIILERKMQSQVLN